MNQDFGNGNSFSVLAEAGEDAPDLDNPTVVKQCFIDIKTALNYLAAQVRDLQVRSGNAEGAFTSVRSSLDRTENKLDNFIGYSGRKWAETHSLADAHEDRLRRVESKVTQGDRELEEAKQHMAALTFENEVFKDQPFQKEVNLDRILIPTQASQTQPEDQRGVDALLRTNQHEAKLIKTFQFRNTGKAAIIRFRDPPAIRKAREALGNHPNMPNMRRSLTYKQRKIVALSSQISSTVDTSRVEVFEKEGHIAVRRAGEFRSMKIYPAYKHFPNGLAGSFTLGDPGQAAETVYQILSSSPARTSTAAGSQRGNQEEQRNTSRRLG